MRNTRLPFFTKYLKLISRLRLFLKLIFDVHNVYGFELSPTLDRLCALVFTNSMVIIARDKVSTLILIETLQSAFRQIGMLINPEKSHLEGPAFF